MFNLRSSVWAVSLALILFSQLLKHVIKSFWVWISSTVKCCRPQCCYVIIRESVPASIEWESQWQFFSFKPCFCMLSFLFCFSPVISLSAVVTLELTVYRHAPTYTRARADALHVQAHTTAQVSSVLRIRKNPVYSRLDKARPRNWVSTEVHIIMHLFPCYSQSGVSYFEKGWLLKCFSKTKGQGKLIKIALFWRKYICSRANRL